MSRYSTILQEKKFHMNALAELYFIDISINRLQISNFESIIDMILLESTKI